MSNFYSGFQEQQVLPGKQEISISRQSNPETGIIIYFFRSFSSLFLL